jgi:hypothetical protein
MEKIMVFKNTAQKTVKSKDDKKVFIAKTVKVMREKLKKLKKKPGGSNVGKYKTVPEKDFAGSVPGSFPINTLARAKSALKLAHNDKNPSAVKAKVYLKYPELREK